MLEARRATLRRPSKVMFDRFDSQHQLRFKMKASPRCSVSQMQSRSIPSTLWPQNILDQNRYPYSSRRFVPVLVSGSGSCPLLPGRDAYCRPFDFRALGRYVFVAAKSNSFGEDLQRKQNKWWKQQAKSVTDARRVTAQLSLHLLCEI
jgi:hypothetical protein